MTNHDIARALSISESTCSVRIKSLITRGVIKGFSALIEPADFGRSVHAVILVTLQPTARKLLLQEAARLTEVDGVLEVLFLAGVHDLLVQVSLPDTTALRDFVVRELSSRDTVASTETSVVMEHLRGQTPVPLCDLAVAEGPSAAGHPSSSARRGE